ncbi:FkbM family methyltransferase [Pseudovibrio flavus]|uniref:FkbM family methyltransferase n=1 Tax=Pseudovibrio flavus TaxID=2529854 RepID=UPI00211BB57C|nr:FkbM family methyltransferase [Pseudovibrio flavus]
MDLVTRVLKPDYFLEIGAHEADTALRIARKLPECTSVGFEADPGVHKHFCEEFEQQGVPENFHYRHMAVTDKVGDVEFFMQPKEDPEFLFANNSLKTKPGQEYESIRVEAATIDSLYKPKSEETAVLKLDVEGHHYEVLEGATDFLDNTQAIYAEVEDYKIWEGQKTVFEVYDLLDGAGFVPVTRDVETPGQYNVMFLKKDIAFDRRFRGRIALYFKELSLLNELAGRNVAIYNRPV